MRGLDSLQPHADEEIHERLMAKLKRMTPHEIFLTSVRAGIHTPEGKLTPYYAGETDTPPTPPAWRGEKGSRKKPSHAFRRTSAKTAQRKSTGGSRRKSAKTSRR
ncbi:hypothetical protein DAT35_53200 [Vitiosangium sp. GDMCC 1.1324]|nr:hypothetical protein DAT35_53200 [Vitiosangium sp. GDMCC 1.1324]